MKFIDLFESNFWENGTPTEKDLSTFVIKNLKNNKATPRTVDYSPSKGTFLYDDIETKKKIHDTRLRMGPQIIKS